MKELGLSVNMETLIVGWICFREIGGCLHVSDINEYITQYLKSREQCSEYEDVLYALDLSEELLNKKFQCYFTRLSDKVKEAEKRKWEVVLLKEKILMIKNMHVTSAMIELNNFWKDMEGVVMNSPHIEQGVHNNLTPKEYYSQTFLDHLLQKYKDWLNANVAILKKLKG